MVSGKELVLDVILSVIMFVMFGIYLYVLYKKQINIEPEYRYIIIIKDSECMVPNIPKIEDNKVKTEPKSEIKTEPKSEIKIESKSETIVEPKTKSNIEPKSEPKSESNIEPKSKVKLEVNEEINSELKEEVKPKFDSNDEYENLFENENTN